MNIQLHRSLYRSLYQSLVELTRINTPVLDIDLEGGSLVMSLPPALFYNGLVGPMNYNEAFYFWRCFSGLAFFKFKGPKEDKQIV